MVKLFRMKPSLVYLLFVANFDRSLISKGHSRKRTRNCGPGDFSTKRLYIFSINLLAFYHKCCNLIGYPSRYLLRDR